MFTELVDTLRCVAVHDDAWLIAAADETEGRHIMTGVLGCPICHARYTIERGTADFIGDGAPRVALDLPGLEPDTDAALKLAAMLDVTDATGYVILMGRWSRLAAPLRDVVQVPILALNPPPDVEMGDGVSGIRSSIRVPVLTSSARSAALDATTASAHEVLLLQSAVHSVRAGGRIVGPASLAVPDDVTEFLRDEDHWVGAREGGRPLLQLVRAPSA